MDEYLNGSNVDGTVAFFRRVRERIGSGDIVMDFGAGRGRGAEDGDLYRRSLRDLRDIATEVIGIDVDPAIARNPMVDRAIVTDGRRMPLANECMDVIVADYVFEHISEPAEVCSELDRILKPGGWICARTPYQRGYVATLSRLVPSSWHPRLVSFLQKERKQDDVFPAFYKLNDQAALIEGFPGYEICLLGFDPKPNYFRGSRLVGALVRYISAIFPDRPAVMFAFLRKPLK